MVPLNKRLLFISWIILLIWHIPSSLLSQTTILTNPGMTYTNSDGPTGPDVYPIGVSNCTAVSFSLDFNFSLPWEGSGNMEIASDCGIGMMPCPGDPANPTQGACNTCWDFLNATFNIDGSPVGGDLEGQQRTLPL